MVAVSLWATLLAAQTAGQDPLAQARTDEDPPPAISVTGERVPRTLRETPSSVDVTTADRLEAMSGADRIDQVLEQVPNVVLGSGYDGPSIRGQDTTGVLQALPAFLGGTRPRTTLQVDGRAVSFNELVFGTAGVWDIERIEVFRTPQTTTQGLNSIAGAIFIHSKDPTYDWEGRGRLIAGNYSMRQVSLAVSGPVIGDQLAFRLAGDLRRGRPSSEIIDVTRGADPNNDDYGLLRFKLLGEPSFWAGARVEIAYAHSESLAPGTEGIRPPFHKRRDPIDRYGVFKTDVDSVTATIRAPLATGLGVATTFSFGDGRIRRFSTPGFGETDTGSRDFSAEALVDWTPAPTAQFVGGVSHRRASLDQFIDLSLFVGIGEFDDDQGSLGVFGEATFHPFPRTIVIAGLRYQRDRQQRAGAIATAANPIPLDYDRTFSAWLPKLSLAYDLSDAIRAGVLVQRASNPGGVTLRLDTGEHETFGAERLWNYELFARGRFAGGAVDVAANLFHTSFRGSQRFRFYSISLPGGSPVTLAEIFNVPRARSRGAELTVDWRMSDQVSARAAVGLLKTQITRTEPASGIFQGLEFARSPRLTAFGGIDWRPVDSFRVSAQARHHSGYFSDDRETAALRIGDATFVDARAAWTRRRVTVFGYVRNLFDAFHLRAKAGGSPPLATAHDPREAGVGLEAQF